MRTLINGGRLEAHVYMERIPIEHVPKDEKECDKWMYDLFEKKVSVICFVISNNDCTICLMYTYFKFKKPTNIKKKISSV